MEIYHLLEIDMNKVSTYRLDTINIKSRDKKRFVNVQVLKSSVPVDLTDYKVVIEGSLGEELPIFADVEKIDPQKGLCRFEITEQMLNSNNLLPLDLVLYGSDGSVSSSTSFEINSIDTKIGEQIMKVPEVSALISALATIAGIDGNFLKVFNELKEKMNKSDPVSAGNISGQIVLSQLSKEIIDAITGNAPISNQVGDKTITKPKIGKGAVSVEETTFLRCGKNLYNKNNRELNRVMQGSIPDTFNIAKNSSYDITDYIPCYANIPLTCIVGVRNIFLFGLDGKCIEVINTGLNTNISKYTFTPKHTGYIRASLYKQYAETWQLEEGSTPTRYEDYKIYLIDSIIKNILLQKQQITDFKVESDDCNFLQVTKNLINPDKILDGKLISKNNTLVDNATYKGYMIELEPGTYTVTGKNRNIFQFDSNLTGTGLISTISNATVDKPITFTIDVKSWIGINFFADVENAQLEKGASATAYEPYGYSMDRLNFTDKQIQKIKSEIEESNTSDSNLLKIVKNNKQYTIYSKLNDKTIKYETEIEEVRNKCFNFVNTYLIKNNKEILVHDQGDDITPIRTFYTVGANHGYPCFSIPSNGQTSADIGSVWTDGVTDYVLAKIENSKCIFLYPYTEDEQGIVGYKNVAPIGNLEAKINATNTNVLNISNLTVDQFYLSVNRHTYDISIDDNELVEGVNLGNEFNVTEKYNILCYKALQEYLKRNIGQELSEDVLNALEGVIELCINYKFKKNALVLINHTLRVLKKVTLGNCGFAQSVRLSPNTEHYMPNARQKGKWNFSQLTNINSYKDNLKFTLSDCINPKYPLNRYVQHRNDVENNKIGFTLGYLPDISSGSNEERLKNSILWDFRSTKKSYPVGYSGGTLEPGAYLNYSIYRKYIDIDKLEEGETNKTYIESGDSLYVFIDIHKNTICDNLEVPKKYIDRSIEILEQNDGFELVNMSVDVRGVNYNIKNGYGYAVLKIK